MMSTKSRSLIAWSSAVTFAFLGAACGSSRIATDFPSDDPSVVAYINGEPLSLAEFEQRYARSVGSWERASEDSLAAYEDFLERYVNFRLKVIEAKALGIHEDPEVVAEISEYRDQLVRPYLLDQQITRPLARMLFERTLEEVNTSHVMIMISGEASPEDTLEAHARITALRDSVLQGSPIDEIAFEHSDDPTARQSRGNLGYFSGGRMVDSYEEVAYTTEVGEISPVFRTPWGFHFLTVHDRRPTRPDIRASHILIRPEDTVPEAREAAFNQIEEIAERIRQGEDFAELAREHSQDGSASNGGDLGYFSSGQMVEPFNEVAFSLENIGDISDVVETRFGYHLIKLTGRRSPPPFEEAYPQIKQMLTRMPRYQAAERELAQQTREREGLTVDSTLLWQVLNSLPEDSAAAHFAEGRVEQQLQDRNLVTLGVEAYTLGDFAEYAGANRPGATGGRERVINLLDRFIHEKALDIEVNRLADGDQEFKELMEQYADGVLLFRVSEDSVWNAAVTDSIGLRAHYEANTGRYNFPERRRIISFYSDSDSTIKAVVAAMGRSAVDELIAQFDSEEQGLTIDTTFLADSTNSVYDQALALDPGEWTEPVRFRRGHIVMYLDGIEAPRGKTFQEARAEVLNDYQARLEEDWVGRLRVRYKTAVFPQHLTAAFAKPSPATASPMAERARSTDFIEID